MFLSKGLTWLALSSVATAGVLPSVLSPRALPLESCPGYTATNITTTSTTVTANLHLAGPACNTYGTDLDNLLLLVEYQNRKSCGTDNPCDLLFTCHQLHVFTSRSTMLSKTFTKFRSMSYLVLPATRRRLLGLKTLSSSPWSPVPSLLP